MGRRGGVRAAVVVVACLLVGLAACGDDDGEDESSADGATTTETEPADDEPTTAPPTPTEQAIAAYNRMWEEEFIALNPPNPAHQGLGEVLTGSAYRQTLDVVMKAQTDGIRVQDGRMETNPLPVSETADKVTLRDCSVEFGTDINLTTGEAVASGPYEPTARVVEVVLIDGAWLVSSIDNLENESCTPG